MNFSLEPLKRTITNISGTSIPNRIIVLESDDWGSIRMSSKESYNDLLKFGYPVNKCAYSRNDALESNNDLEFLFEVLSMHKGIDGNPAILTANNIVANPDFERIKESNFLEYYYEPFIDTLKRYPNHDNVMYLYKEGIKAGVILPQFHGREHLNVGHWLNGLRNKEPKAVDAFLHGMFSVFIGKGSSCNNEYLNAMAYFNELEASYVRDSVSTGLDLFEKIWGFKSLSVIAPCYQWHSSLEKVFFQSGVKIIQGGRAQIEPILGSASSTKPIRHNNGQKNSFNQVYTVRNVIFEPSTNLDRDWIDSAMKEISSAFFWKQPAIISTHRLNYIGWINPKNRDNNLKLLQELLKRILQVWPDVVFTTSDKMTKYYN